MSTDLRPSMIAVSVVGSVSSVVCASFLTYFGYLALANFTKHRTGRNQRKAQGDMTTKSGTSMHSELRRIDNQFGALFLQMVAADLISALGFAMSGRFVIISNRPEVNQIDRFCEFQGVFITLGDLTSGLFAMVIAVHTGVVLGTQRRVSRRACAIVSVLTWSLAVVLEIIGPLAIATTDTPYYAFTSIWCFASNNYPLMRLATHYAFIFASFFISLVVYVGLYIHFNRHYNRSRDVLANDVLLKTARSMLLYPLAYSVCVLPLALFRLASLAGKTGPPQLLAVAGICFACAGTVNVVTYSLTRRLINFNNIRARVMKVGRPTFGEITVRTEQIVVCETDGYDQDKKDDSSDKTPPEFVYSKMPVHRTDRIADFQ